MSFDLYLQAMADTSTDIPLADFHEVSDLSPEELGQFARAWIDLPEERQLDIVSTMVQMAEENLDLDFSAIFKM